MSKDKTSNDKMLNVKTSKVTKCRNTQPSKVTNVESVKYVQICYTIQVFLHAARNLVQDVCNLAKDACNLAQDARNLVQDARTTISVA